MIPKVGSNVGATRGTPPSLNDAQKTAINNLTRSLQTDLRELITITTNSTNGALNTLAGTMKENSSQNIDSTHLIPVLTDSTKGAVSQEAKKIANNFSRNLKLLVSLMNANSPTALSSAPAHPSSSAASHSSMPAGSYSAHPTHAHVHNPHSNGRGDFLQLAGAGLAGAAVGFAASEALDELGDLFKEFNFQGQHEQEPFNPPGDSTEINVNVDISNVGDRQEVSAQTNEDGQAFLDETETNEYTEGGEEDFFTEEAEEYYGEE